jgi:hypothetical protein
MGASPNIVQICIIQTQISRYCPFSLNVLACPATATAREIAMYASERNTDLIHQYTNWQKHLCYSGQHDIISPISTLVASRSKNLQALKMHIDAAVGLVSTVPAGRLESAQCTRLAPLLALPLQSIRIW